MECAPCPPILDVEPELEVDATGFRDSNMSDVVGTVLPSRLAWGILVCWVEVAGGGWFWGVFWTVRLDPATL